MVRMHELFEHTADLGLRATASNLDDLFVEAGICLTSAIVDDIDTIEPRVETTVRIEGTDLEYLMFDWLRHLLYLFEEGQWLFRTFEVKHSESGLSAIAFGEPYDPTRHALAREVKAITYHELKVEPTADGWLAEVIVDI